MFGDLRLRIALFFIRRISSKEDKLKKYEKLYSRYSDIGLAELYNLGEKNKKTYIVGN